MPAPRDLQEIVDFLDPTSVAPSFVDTRGVLQPANPVDEPAVPRYFNSTGGVWLYARSIARMEGLEPLAVTDPITGVPEYNFALVTVRYESVTFIILTDQQTGLENNPSYGTPAFNGEVFPAYEYGLKRYITRTSRPVMEYLALPRGRMHWTDWRDKALGDATADRGTVDYASAVPTPSTELIWSWHGVPFVPEAAFTHVGKLNLYDFDDGVRVYRAGTLLLLGCELRPYRQATGNFVVDVQYRVKHFEPFPDATKPARGHNYFLRYRNDVSTLAFQKITMRGLGDYLDFLNGLSPSDPTTGQLLFNVDYDHALFGYSDFRELFSWHARPPIAGTYPNPSWGATVP